MGLPVLGVLGSLVSGLAGMMGKSSPPSPPAPVAPPPPPEAPSVEPAKEPEGALDEEAAKQRALQRRRASQTQGLTLLDDTTQTTDQKKLVGE